MCPELMPVVRPVSLVISLELVVKSSPPKQLRAHRGGRENYIKYGFGYQREKWPLPKTF
jgi:hypothetical protein